MRYAFIAGLVLCFLLIPINRWIAAGILKASKTMMTHKVHLGSQLFILAVVAVKGQTFHMHKPTGIRLEACDQAQAAMHLLPRLCAFVGLAANCRAERWALWFGCCIQNNHKLLEYTTS